MLAAVHITLTILILSLWVTPDTNISLVIFLMQLSSLVTCLEILKEEISTQWELKQLIIMSVLLIQNRKGEINIVLFTKCSLAKFK